MPNDAANFERVAESDRRVTEVNRPKKRSWLRWLGLTIGGLFVFWFVGGFALVLWLAGYDVETMLSGKLPKCDSKFATDLAKQSLQGSPLAKMINISVFDIKSAQEMSYDSGSEKRTCKAVAFLNSGKRDIVYTLEWQNPGDCEHVWLEIKDLD